MWVLKMKQKSDFPVDQTCFWAGLELLHKGEDWKESANHSAILDGLHLSSCLDLASKDSQSVVKVLITKRCTFQVTVCCCLKPIDDDIPLGYRPYFHFRAFRLRFPAGFQPQVMSDQSLDRMAPCNDEPLQTRRLDPKSMWSSIPHQNISPWGFW